MERAVRRQSGGVSPTLELLREHVGVVAAAALGRQQRQVADGRGGNGCREIGMHRDRQRRAGLLLADGHHAVLDVLTAQAQRHCAAVPYRGRAQARAGLSSRWDAAPRTRQPRPHSSNGSRSTSAA